MTEARGFVRGINLTAAVSLVIGSMIGSGIFIVSADIGRQVGSPGNLLMVWILTGVITIIGAVTQGELAAMYTGAGGQYVYLREGLSPLWGFLYGWTLFMVIQTGTIAAVAVAFGRFTGVIFPAISETVFLGGDIGKYHVGLSAARALGIVTVLLLTWINVQGVKTAAWIQTVLTAIKVLTLGGLILLGITIGRHADAIAANFHHFWEPTSFSLAILPAMGVAMVGSLFSSDAWNNVAFAAAEVENPRRNLPLALFLGTLTVSLIYCLVNVSYLHMMTLDTIEHVANDRVGTAAAQVLFGGAGATLMAVGIMISTFGCNNGLILSGARVYYAMACDGLFFRKAGQLDATRRTPKFGLWAQTIWTCLLCLSGSYGDLLNYVIFAAVLFYFLTVIALFRLRSLKPDAERPYRAVGYPWLQVVYCILLGAIMIDLLIKSPQYTWPGLIIVLIGVPVYFVWRRVGTPQAA